MATVPMKLVTIIAEQVLREQLTSELKALGSTGITFTEAMGEGSKHLHSGEVPGTKIKIEAVVPAAVAKKIIARISGKYFSHYSIIAYVSDVYVVRREKYEGPSAKE